MPSLHTDPTSLIWKIVYRSSATGHIVVPRNTLGGAGSGAERVTGPKLPAVWGGALAGRVESVTSRLLRLLAATCAPLSDELHLAGPAR